MNLFEGVRIALESLRGHKLRTFLTLLGNIVGTMSVIAVVSLIYGADRYVSQVVLDEGTDVFTITRIDDLQFLTDFDAFLESLNNPDLTLDDRDWLAERMQEASSVGALITRTELLLTHHGDGAPPLDAPALHQAVQTVAISARRLHWQDCTCWSSRQRTSMQLGGLLGELTLTGAGL